MHDAFYTLFNDIINKFMPVMHHALHAEIHIIRLGAAGIDAQPCNFNLRGIFKHLRQLHKTPPLADSQPANPRPAP